MTIEDGALELPIVVTGKAEALASLREVDGAATKTGQAQTVGAQATARAAADATRQQTALGNAAQQSGVKLSAFGSTLGLAGQAVGRFHQQGGQMVGILGQSVGSITSLTATLGPMGLAIGLATTAFALMSAASGDAKTKLEQAAEAARASTNAFLGMVDGITQAERAQARMNLLLAGGGTPGEQDATRTGLRTRIANANARLAQGVRGDATGFLEARADLIAARRELGQVLANQPAYDRDRAMIEGPGRGATAGRQILDYSGGQQPERPTPTRPRRSGGGGGTTADFTVDASDVRRGLDAFLLRPLEEASRSVERFSESLETLVETGMVEASEGLSELGREILGGTQQSRGQGNARPVGQARQGSGEDIRLDDKGLHDIEMGYALAADEAERLRDITNEVSESFAEMTRLVVEGEMSLGQAFFAVSSEKLKAKGYEMIGEGAANVLAGAALAIALPLSPQGAALAVTGGLQIAGGSALVAGGVLGAMAAAGLAGGGGATGGGGSRSAREPARLPSGEGGGATVINVDMRGVVTAGTHVELADTIEDTLAKGRSRRR